MKKLNEILFITEDISEDTKWYLSFLKPKFQGGESIEISKEEAIILLNILDTNNENFIGNKDYLNYKIN